MGRGAIDCPSSNKPRISIPSHLKSSLDGKPASAQKVGTQSVICTGEFIFPALIRPGQETSVGTRVPPSYTLPFCPRKGRLLPVSRPLGQLSSGYFKSLFSAVLLPLSLVKTTSVFSYAPISFNVSRTRATLSIGFPLRCAAPSCSRLQSQLVAIAAEAS